MSRPHGHIPPRWQQRIPLRAGRYLIGAGYGLGSVVAVWSLKIFVTDNFYDMTKITGVSMVPSLNARFAETGEMDRIAWKMWEPTTGLKKGDVVHLRCPHNSEECAVKRVIALEGDTVVLNPLRRPSRQRDGADVPESKGWDAWRGRTTVPEGHVWVEGDNWRKSRDSNWYGPISRSLITGKAMWLMHPLGAKPWEEYKSNTRVVKGKIVKSNEDDMGAIWEGYG